MSRSRSGLDWDLTWDLDLSLTIVEGLKPSFDSVKVIGPESFSNLNSRVKRFGKEKRNKNDIGKNFRKKKLTEKEDKNKRRQNLNKNRKKKKKLKKNKNKKKREKKLKIKDKKKTRTKIRIKVKTSRAHQHAAPLKPT